MLSVQPKKKGKNKKEKPSYSEVIKDFTPMFSSGTFIVSFVTFTTWIYLEYLLVYRVSRSPI